MSKSKTFRWLSLLLCLVMVIGLFPTVALAYNPDYQSETHTVFKHTEQTLAPGVEYYNNYAYLNDGEQIVYYVATADINRDDVLVQGSYWNMQTEQYGMSKLTEQAASANAKYADPNSDEFISENYTVVAGTNGDFYNMQTGRPSGAFVINGSVMNESNNRPWFAIFTDGTALCGANAAAWDAAVAEHGAVQQAVGGSQMLVVDGKDVTANASGDYNTDRHSRTMIGVTADNKVVSVVLDGRQSPFSAGGSMHELAQIMIEADCVLAINLDGGGSTTFGARPEGEDNFKVINRPSDGSERSISSGVIIASLAAPSNVFDRAAITVENDYVTPYSEVGFSVVGVSSSGASAEVPAEVTYEATLGSVVNGKFVSDGTVGDAVISAVYNDEVVGSATIHVVVPESIAFNQETFTVPYGKSMDLGITAKYGLNKVAVKPADFNYALEIPEGAGQIVNGAMVAPEEGAEAAANTVTATLVYDETKTATANIAFGKASVVLFDFEDGTTQNWVRYNTAKYNYIHTRGTTSNVTAENGQVHSGNHALRVDAKFSETWEAGYISGRLGVSGLDEIIDLKGATCLGFWMYIPVDNASFNGRMFLCKVTERDPETGAITKYDGYYTNPTIDGTDAANCGFMTQYDEAGWHYVSFDLSGGDDWCIIQNATLYDFYINDRNGDSYGYNHLNYKSQNNDMALYIDDVTVDYSSVVEDRDRPVFSNVLLGDRGPHSNDALELTNGYVSDGFNQISLAARVAENTKNSNYSGLNAASAKIYIDGKEVPCTFANGLMSADEYTFTNGQHTVKFAIQDNNGNYASVIRTFSVVNTDKEQQVWIEAKDPNADRILLGSLYWVNVKALDASAVTSVSLDLDLNNLSVWELDHMDVAQGFDASYSIINADENVARVTITRNSDELALLDGDAIISMPIRTWELPAVAADYGHAGVVWMYDKYRAGNEVWPVDVEVKVAAGQADFADGSSAVFTGANVQVDTESIYWDNDNAKASDPYYTSWNGGHDHRAETAQYYGANTTNHTTEGQVVYVEGFEPKAATCTEDGFTGRTFCTVCNSVVDWGEVIPATGHDFQMIDGVVKCAACGELLTGEFEGKMYVDGVIANGWVENSYFADGVMYTGIQAVDDVYHDFGEDGVCPNRAKYTGLVQKDGKWYYSKLGVLTGGWTQIDDEWYYFKKSDLSAATGAYKVSGIDYEFEENGKLVSGVWVNDGKGTRYYYGPDYYRLKKTVTNVLWEEIDGNTYGFDLNGYRYEGLKAIRESNATHYDLYVFSDEGVCLGLYEGTETGLLTQGDGTKVYVVEGKPTHAGLVEVDGDYYYIGSNCQPVTGSRYIYWTYANGLVEPGEYEFDTDGKMIDPEKYIIGYVDPDAPVVVKNGIVDGYYYVDDVPTHAGLIEYEGDYYYIKTGGKVGTGTQHIYWSWANGLVTPGDYEFDADGKMIDPAKYIIGYVDPDAPVVVKEGIVDGYYYENGELVHAGLIEYEGDYYYIKTGGKVGTGTQHIYWSWANGLVTPGDYEFDADGKMIDPAKYIIGYVDPDAPVVVKEGIVDGYYYENGELVHAGLIEYEGDYYYIQTGGKVATGEHYIYWSWANGLVNPGTYDFGTDGKLVDADQYIIH